MSGSEPEHNLNHEKSRQGDKGEQERNKEQILHDFAYTLLSIGVQRSVCAKTHSRTLQNISQPKEGISCSVLSSICYDYCVEGKRFIRNPPSQPLTRNP